MVGELVQQQPGGLVGEAGVARHVGGDDAGQCGPGQWPDLAVEGEVAGRAPVGGEKDQCPVVLAAHLAQVAVVALELVAGFRGVDLGFDEHREVGAFDGDVHPAVAFFRQWAFHPGVVGRLPRPPGELGQLQMFEQGNQQIRPLAMVAEAVEQPAEHGGVADLVLPDPGAAPGVGKDAAAQVAGVGGGKRGGKFGEPAGIQPGWLGCQPGGEAVPGVEEGRHGCGGAGGLGLQCVPALEEGVELRGGGHERRFGEGFSWQVS